MIHADGRAVLDAFHFPEFSGVAPDSDPVEFRRRRDLDRGLQFGLGPICALVDPLAQQGDLVRRQGRGLARRRHLYVLVRAGHAFRIMGCPPPFPGRMSMPSSPPFRAGRGHPGGNRLLGRSGPVTAQAGRSQNRSDIRVKINFLVGPGPWIALRPGGRPTGKASPLERPRNLSCLVRMGGGWLKYLSRGSTFEPWTAVWQPAVQQVPIRKNAGVINVPM